MVHTHLVLDVQPNLEAIASARHAIRDHLAGCGMRDTGEAELIVSELVGNAVVHAGGDISVTVDCGDDLTLVIVHDCSRVLPAPAPPHVRRPGGHGLRIVAALADRWGVEPDGDEGKNVWFELAGGSS